MSHLVAIGRVTADLELKMSVRQNPYIQFSLAEQIGYGETARTQYIQVWAWGVLTQQLLDRSVRKGSLISVSGSLELEEYTKKDGVTRDKRLKLKLTDWDFVPTGRRDRVPKEPRGLRNPKNPALPVPSTERGIPCRSDTPAQNEEALYYMIRKECSGHGYSASFLFSSRKIFERRYFP